MDVTQAVSTISTAISSWLQALTQDTHLYQRLIDTPEHERLTALIQAAMVPALVSVVLQAPILSLLGIEWTNAGFHLANFTILLLTQLAMASSIFWGLSLHRIRTKFVSVAAAYVATVVPWLPLLSILVYPNTIKMYLAIRAARVANLDLFDTMRSVFADIESIHPVLAAYNSFAAVVITTVSAVLITRMMELLFVEGQDIDRWKASSGVALGMSIGGIAGIALALLNSFAIYAFSSTG